MLEDLAAQRSRSTNSSLAVELRGRVRFLRAHTDRRPAGRHARPLRHDHRAGLRRASTRRGGPARRASCRSLRRHIEQPHRRGLRLHPARGADHPGGRPTTTARPARHGGADQQVRRRDSTAAPSPCTSASAPSAGCPTPSAPTAGCSRRCWTPTCTASASSSRAARWPRSSWSASGTASRILSAGLIDIKTHYAETPEDVVERDPHLPAATGSPSDLEISTDCGLRRVPRNAGPAQDDTRRPRRRAGAGRWLRRSGPTTSAACLRPPYLKAAHGPRRAGADELRARQDAAMRDALALQAEAGCPWSSDGELRRRIWYDTVLAVADGFDPERLRARLDRRGRAAGQPRLAGGGRAR